MSVRARGWLTNCVWVAVRSLGVAAGLTTLDRWLERIDERTGATLRRTVDEPPMVGLVAASIDSAV